MRLFGGSLSREAAALASLTLTLTALSPNPVAAQELKFDFNSPSFGGNPFNSTSLLAIATAQRPEKKTVVTPPLTAAQTFAAQLQARLLSAFSSGLVTAITGSASGTSGSYDLGGQRVTFSNDGTNITVTIVDDATGETTVITVPVYTFGKTAAAAAADPAVVRTSVSASSASLEASLAGTAPISGTALAPAGQLDAAPVERAQQPIDGVQ
ncbi:curli assembly protein CsgF [Sphingomonas sp. MMS24-J45]|uniref:curli assembly protein CsgF n=1 Tax=Sphingomonas sp. MMS24-J45 TaxID=3238806 RepID=UPI00384C23FD